MHETQVPDTRRLGGAAAAVLPPRISSPRKRTIVASCPACAPYASTVAGLAARYRAHCASAEAAEANTCGKPGPTLRIVEWQDSPCTICGTTCLASAAAAQRVCALCASLASELYITDTEVKELYGCLISVKELCAGRLDSPCDTIDPPDTLLATAGRAGVSLPELLWESVARIVICCSDPYLVSKLRKDAQSRQRLIIRARRVYPCWCMIAHRVGVTMRTLCQNADAMHRSRVSDLGVLRFESSALLVAMRRWEPCSYHCTGGRMVFTKDAVAEAICHKWHARSIGEARKIHAAGPAALAPGTLPTGRTRSPTDSATDPVSIGAIPATRQRQLQ